MSSRKLTARLGRLWDRHLGLPAADLRTGRRKHRVSDAQSRLLRDCAEHPFVFLSACDPEDGRPLIWTKDEADERQPIKPFPADLVYVRLMIDVLHGERLVLVDKARQMYVTTTVMLYCLWYGLFRKARRMILSKSTEKEAKEILKDKVRFVHGQMPLWAQGALPLALRPQRVVNFTNQASVLIGAAQNVAETEARGGTASIVIVDEAARQSKFASIVAACTPMIMGRPGVTAGKLFAMTTPDIGTQGAADFKSYLDDAVAQGGGLGIGLGVTGGLR